MHRTSTTIMFALLAASAAYADDMKAPPPAAAETKAPAAKAADAQSPANKLTTPADIGPRHAGQLVDAGDGVHAEVLISDRSMSVWFYDSEMKPMALPNDAKATLKVNKETKKLALTKGAGDVGLFAGGLDLPKSAKVEVNLKAHVGGKVRTVKLARQEEVFPQPAVTPGTTLPLKDAVPAPTSSPKLPEPQRG